MNHHDSRCICIHKMFLVLHPSQKNEIILLSIALPNIDRFSKFFHHQTQQETCNKAIMKDHHTLKAKYQNIKKL